jgi:hypothetical protein
MVATAYPKSYAATCMSDMSPLKLNVPKQQPLHTEQHIQVKAAAEMHHVEKWK